MLNKTDKGTSLVSKLLPVANSNSVNRLFSARNKKYYVSLHERFTSSLCHRCLLFPSDMSYISGLSALVVDNYTSLIFPLQCHLVV